MRFKRLLLLLLMLAPLVAVAALALFLLNSRTNHQLSQWMIIGSFIFVVSFVSLLLLRIIFFALFSLIHQVVYRIRLKHYMEEERLGYRFQPLVSIIVPAYNEGKVIEAALESHTHINYPRFEIVVVDDGSADDTADRARSVAERFPKANIRVFTVPNGGKGNALNYGIKQAQGHFILTVDADSRIDPDSLWFAMRHFRDPKVGAVGGNIKVMNQRGVMPSLQSLEYIIGQNLTRRVFGLFHSVSIVPGPFGLFRYTALEDAGFFDDDTFAEDCDLTLKMIAHGWRVVDEMNAIARTEAPEQLRTFIRQRYRWTRGTLQAVFKHKRALWAGSGNKRLTVILWLMIFDGIAWPIANMICHLCVFYLIFEVGLATFLVFWWIHFTLLDAALALLCIGAERENPFLVAQAVLYRLFFVIMMDLCKILSSIEELLDIRMGWGKLERIGHDYSQSTENSPTTP